MRKTKIICTIGPKSDSDEMLKRLAEKGMNIARINMSHGNHEYIRLIIKRIKKLNRTLESPIAVMLDTQGPEIRIGKLEKDITVTKGSELIITAQDIKNNCKDSENTQTIPVNYTGICKLQKDNKVLIDDGMVSLKVTGTDKQFIKCIALNNGIICSHKSVNLPGMKVDIPSITNKDMEDIRLGIKENVDFIALSFIRHHDDIKKIRKYLESNGSDMHIISKIEDPEGIENIDNIIKVSDSIMIARGDLGVEIPFEDVPIIGKKIIKKCIRLCKPVIVATHLLDSMIQNPRPTRAEVSDVANAVFDKADCIMLSGETTVGDYPIESVNTLDRIAQRSEKELETIYNSASKLKSIKEELCKDACICSDNLNAKAILVFTRTGRLARQINKHRPSSDIFIFVEHDYQRRKITLMWGTHSFRINFGADYKKMIKTAEKHLKENGFLKKNDLIVILSDVNSKAQNTDILEVRRIV